MSPQRERTTMILYFSGTGNSRYAARIIQSVTGDESISMNDLIKNGNSKPLHSEKPLVFVCPTYAWRIPRVVEKFIRDNEFAGSKKAYFVLTCGDEIGNALRYINKLCAEKCFELLGLAPIVMPENYIALFKTPDKTKAEVQIQSATPEIHALAEQIKDERVLGETKSGLVGYFQSGIINSIFYYFFVKAKGFYSTDACTHCGQCAQLCPFNNVALVKGVPGWGSVCTHCMACIGGCPSEAIEYKKNSLGQRRYYIH
jgi:ferredoxin